MRDISNMHPTFSFKWYCYYIFSIKFFIYNTAAYCKTV